MIGLATGPETGLKQKYRLTRWQFYWVHSGTELKTEEIPGAKVQEDRYGSETDVTLIAWQGIQTNLGTWTEKPKELFVDMEAKINLRTESVNHLITDIDQTRISSTDSVKLRTGAMPSTGTGNSNRDSCTHKDLENVFILNMSAVSFSKLEAQTWILVVPGTDNIKTMSSYKHKHKGSATKSLFVLGVTIWYQSHQALHSQWHMNLRHHIMYKHHTCMSHAYGVTVHFIFFLSRQQTPTCTIMSVGAEDNSRWSSCNYKAQ